MDNVDIKKLFTRFYQGKHNEGGSGIGLSYAKMLIDLHGGRMGAFNNKDRGATFFYEIPANLQEQEVSCPQHSYLNELLSSPEEEEKIESGSFSLQGYSLLIVEDKQDLREFLKNEYTTKIIYPDKYDIFNALHYTSYKDVKVVILGQDPYHGPNQAHGLSFSVSPGVKIPPSLLNIYKELNSDLECYIPNNGYLKKWADQGVLLLNTSLTVRAGEANSHKNKGWEIFTDKIISLINEKTDPVVFLLWGNNAINKKKLITNKQHLILSSTHPSPLSASRGFFGSKPFSKINKFLISVNKAPIDWQIENI